MGVTERYEGLNDPNMSRFTAAFLLDRTETGPALDQVSVTRQTHLRPGLNGPEESSPDSADERDDNGG